MAVADDGGAPGVGAGDSCWTGCGSAVEEAGAEATPDGVLETDALGGDVGALTDMLVALAGALGELAGAVTAADRTARFAV